MFTILDVVSAGNPPLNWLDLGLTKGISIGSFMLRWYSLAYLLGILFAYWHTAKAIKLAGAPLAQRHADDLFFWCTLGIIIGGRLGYATFYSTELWAHPLDLFKVWEGGMSFHGGLIGVTLAFALVSWRCGLSFLRVADFVAVSVPMGMLLGRLANFTNGELWGRVAGPDVGWAMIFPGAGPLARHPSQLYEAGLEGALLLIIMLLLFWRTKARFRPGLLSATFIGLMGIFRFGIEFFREPDSQLTEFAAKTGLSMGQWLTVPMVLIGIFFVIRALRRAPLAA